MTGYEVQFYELVMRALKPKGSLDRIADALEAIATNTAPVVAEDNGTTVSWQEIGDIIGAQPGDDIRLRLESLAALVAGVEAAR